MGAGGAVGRGLEVEAKLGKGAKRGLVSTPAPIPLSVCLPSVLEVTEPSRSAHLLDEPQFPSLQPRAFPAPCGHIPSSRWQCPTEQRLRGCGEERGLWSQPA